MANNPADQFFHPLRSETRARQGTVSGHSSRSRVPSSIGYLIGAFTGSAAVFFLVWGLLLAGGDQAPWIPAGLAAAVVLLVTLSAREVVMRRAWTRYLLEHGVPQQTSRAKRSKAGASRNTYSTSLHSAALAAIQKRSSAVDSSSSAEAHFEIFKLCQNYLDSAAEALRSNSLSTEKRHALKSGQERARALERHHLLTWARDSSRSLTHEAQRRARMYDKIETAHRAIDCLDFALKIFPDEQGLNESKLAIKEFIASVKVAHWVELAERAAFKGHYRRAINRYKDALFYLDRESVKEDVRRTGSEKIELEIELLQARLKSPAQSAEPGTFSGKPKE